MFPQRSTYRPTDGLGAYYETQYNQPIHGLGADKVTGAVLPAIPLMDPALMLQAAQTVKRGRTCGLSDQELQGLLSNLQRALNAHAQRKPHARTPLQATEELRGSVGRECDRHERSRREGRDRALIAALALGGGFVAWGLWRAYK